MRGTTDATALVTIAQVDWAPQPLSGLGAAITYYHSRALAQDDFEIAPRTNGSAQAGCRLNINPGNPNARATETMLFSVFGPSRSTGNGGSGITFNANANITRQRTVFIGTASLGAPAGDTAGIAYAASFYILGAPALNAAEVSSNSGNYALWVDDGDVRIDGNLRLSGNMLVGSSNSLAPSVFFTASTNGVVSNTTAETTVIGSGTGTLLIPANYITHGKVLRVTAYGLYSTQLVPVGLTMRVKLGGSSTGSAGTEILTTGSQTPAGNVSNLYWKLMTDLTFISSGASGLVIGQSAWEHQSTATGSPVYWQMTTLLPVVVDTTTQNRVQLTAQWATGVAAGDSMNCTNFALEVLN